jgi:basic membrane protein A
MKKAALIALSLTLIITSDVPAAFNCGKPDTLCIGVVTDVGEIDDKSFNQSAWEGVKTAAEQFDAQVKYIETRDAKDYGANVGLFINNKYDIIVTIGFALGEATLKAAKKNPNIDFIGVDQFQVKPEKNLAGLVFHEEQAGFLAGSLAAMLTKSKKVAAVLGTDLVPPVVMFKKGYEAGAKYIHPKIRIISTYHPGGLDVAFTDPEWGAATTKQALDQGADVIFGAGGKTGNGSLIETAAHSGRYCIGVDTDQWATLPEARPCLVSSAMKLITPGVFKLIKLSKEGKFPPGNHFGDVGLAPFHDFDGKIPQDVKDKLKKIDRDLRSGALMVPTN